MYDEEFTLAGLGTFAIGSVVFDAAWLVVAGVAVAVTALFLLRFALRIPLGDVGHENDDDA